MKRNGRGYWLPRAGTGALDGDDPLAPPMIDYAHNLFTQTRLRRMDIDARHAFDANALMIELAETIQKGAEADLLPTLRKYLRKNGAARRTPRPVGSPAASNLEVIAEVLAFDATQLAIFQFLLALRQSRALREIADALGAVSATGAVTLIAAAVALPERHVAEALDRSGRLVGSGVIVMDDDDHRDLSDKFKFHRGIVDAVSAVSLDRAGLLTRFLPIASKSALDWPDVEHAKQPATMARDILGAALRDRRPGVNILLHGDTGTGKTELAKLLADDIGAKLYVAGLSLDDGGSPSATERLMSLRLGHRLIPAESSVMLFDEVEDLFRWESASLFSSRTRGTPTMSKQWFNAVLETNPVPTIWVSNQIDGIDPAFLRRFTYALELRPLGPRQRERILLRHLGENTYLTRHEVESVAHRFTASPAQIGSAVATAKLLRADATVDRATLEELLTPMQRLLSGEDPTRRRTFDPSTYRLDVTNASQDLTVLTEQAVAWPPGELLSLCLYGPPGTGKSEYVKYLAHRMGRPVLCKKVSDVVSPFVGGTERAIAAAFREAEESDAVLLFDEVDSFLRDRTMARHSWEVTAVNEFLQQLESYTGVVACTTNLWKDIDPASLRRFVMKVELRYLTTDQAMVLYRELARALGAELKEEGVELEVRGAIERAGVLTPGDFALVRRRVRSPLSPADLLHEVHREIEGKARRRDRIGFTHANPGNRTS